MVALACGSPLRAADGPAWRTAWVELRAADVPAAQALCRSLRGLPVRLRLLEVAGTVRLEISAACEGQLAAALERLRRWARAAGVKFRTGSAGSGAEVWNLSGRSMGLHPPQRGSRPMPAVLTEPEGTCPRCVLPAGAVGDSAPTFLSGAGEFWRRGPPLA